MAVDSKNLSVLAYSNGFTLWHYKAAEACAEDIEADGYFNKVGNIFNGGDVLFVSFGGGSAASTLIYSVVSASSSNVVVGAML
jgi:hypothetical protein